MTAVRRLVDQEARRSVVVANQDVHVAVVVDVAKGGASANLGELEDFTRPIADLLESSTAQAVEQQFPLVQRQGILRLPERLDDLDGPVHGQQIELPIVVEVEPRRPETSERHAGRTEA